MIRLFQFVILILGLSIVALACAIVAMRFAIHGAEVTVPNFKGMTAQQALNKAADLGVEMTIDNRFYSADLPAGRILTQSPAPGTVVRKEWHLRAAESLGPQTVAIPNLVGQPQRAATIEIRRLGLEPGTVAHMPFASAPPETIVAQDPPAGAAGVEKPSVSVIVSDPAPPQALGVVMPDFIGQQYVTASATISRAGLKLLPATPSSASEIAGNTVTSGTVTAQTPQAGYRADADTPIELTVSR
jgi:beta-lactam-binding protein with PASTA domain